MSAQRHDTLPYSLLHDDGEGDLVGADWHQEAIRATVISPRDHARRRQLPWHVGDQLTLVATTPAGDVWRPCPDIMLHPFAGPAKRKEMAVGSDGIPALIIDVASASTWEYDVDTRAGKAWGVLALGVPDYLVFDPYRDLLGEACRGWQRRDGVVQPWRPEADGRYHASALDISFRPEDDLLRVYDAEGNPVAFYFENAELADRVAELEAELARLRGSL